jgi:Flp pilus assembly protein TadG
MMRLPTTRKRRRGAILVLMVIMMVVLLAFVALALDLGYAMVVRNQLQNAADSTALAGTSQVLEPLQLGGTPNLSPAITNAVTNANTQAQNFGSDNKAGGVAVTLGSNTSNDPTGDIVSGHLTNPSDLTQQLSVTVMGQGPFPNSVQTKARRDSGRNGSLTLSFARVMGFSTLDMQAAATATYEDGIVGFKIHTPGVGTCKLLPFALDVNTWNSVLAGNGPDDWSRDNTTQAISAGSDGIHECKLFPLSNGTGSNNSGLPPGNFGTINIGDSMGTSTTNRQILYGPNASDFAYYTAANGYPNGFMLAPATPGGTPQLLLQGNTGVSAAMKAALEQIIGQPRCLPLYSSVSGPGANCTYTIVQFVGVTVCEEVLTGSLASKHITIQPCWCIDANAIGGGGAGQSPFIVKPLALTR